VRLFASIWLVEGLDSCLRPILHTTGHLHRACDKFTEMKREGMLLLEKVPLRFITVVNLK